MLWKRRGGGCTWPAACGQGAGQSWPVQTLCPITGLCPAFLFNSAAGYLLNTPGVLEVNVCACFAGQAQVGLAGGGEQALERARVGAA